MEIAIKILQQEINQREHANKSHPNHLRLKETTEEIESMKKAIVELEKIK